MPSTEATSPGKGPSSIHFNCRSGPCSDVFGAIAGNSTQDSSRFWFSANPSCSDFVRFAKKDVKSTEDQKSGNMMQWVIWFAKKISGCLWLSAETLMTCTTKNLGPGACLWYVNHATITSRFFKPIGFMSGTNIGQDDPRSGIFCCWCFTISRLTHGYLFVTLRQPGAGKSFWDEAIKLKLHNNKNMLRLLLLLLLLLLLFSLWILSLYIIIIMTLTDYFLEFF